MIVGIVGGRRNGKTVELIRQAYENDITIICKSDVSKERIMTIANNLELKIKEPKTLEELKVGD